RSTDPGRCAGHESRLPVAGARHGRSALAEHTDPAGDISNNVSLEPAERPRGTELRGDIHSLDARICGADDRTVRIREEEYRRLRVASGIERPACDLELGRILGQRRALFDVPGALREPELRRSVSEVPQRLDHVGASEDGEVPLSRFGGDPA